MSRDERSVPRTMASQHPDHVSPPPWSREPMISGVDEVVEVYWAYAEYGTDEVMWDAEGKDIDPNVVRKLLTSYPEFFKTKRLGREVYLTFRLPNPSIEVVERKVFLETLQSIPRHNDVAKAFYGDSDRPAVFEVILPFTTSHVELLRVGESYRKAVAAPLLERIDFQGTRLVDWVGDIEPEFVDVIPLVEDIDTVTNLERLLIKYAELVGPRYIRTFIARSDPAMNYGFVVAVLLAKYGLWACRRASEQLGIPIFPIIGAGALPFRGHNSPDNVESLVEEYRGVYTVTIQSAFRYDYPIDQARSAISKLKSVLPRGEAKEVNRDLLLEVASKLVPAFQFSIESAARAINMIASHIPPRRARRQHIGLFGYSRTVGSIRLPRAIPFTASLYSIGMPPELIGLRAINSLSEEEFDFVLETHLNLRRDLEAVGRRVSWECISLINENSEAAKAVFGPEFVDRFVPKYLEDLSIVEEQLGLKTGPRTVSDRMYLNSVENVMIALLTGHDPVQELVRAASLRRSLG
ncbi:MAG: phosphoenolpyruvate carboxylase [Thaumarchaeota archaeon]|nr:phosphoenolpyruvate carboxylase [Candidatus Calditenuaceae archaeon]MDW8186872.1 phosphoenolpyruvate carboxylase [Nitrososphaerota archaeon]